jgi:arylsulfatase
MTQKNILLVTVDEWAAKVLGCAGHPVVETPTLDMLAKAGRRYTNA